MARETCAPGTVRDPRPPPFSPSALPSLSSFVPRTLFVLVLVAAAGCTFERRPETQPNADVGAIDTTASEESATGFLQRFQAARSGSDPSDLRGLVGPGATVMVDGRALDLGGSADGGDGVMARDTGRAAVESGGDAWRVLAGEPAAASPGPQVTDSALFDDSALFVVRYDSSVETILLAHDSAGWSLRLLHRVTAGSENP